MMTTAILIAGFLLLAAFAYWLALKSKAELAATRELLKLEYENIARRQIETGQEKMKSWTQDHWQQLVVPFDKELKTLQEKIHQTYDKESRERLSLRHEIEFMMRAQTQLSVETQSLTKALRGDVKTQGNWGEVVLERILESSGLREGQEFIIQGKGLGLKSEDGNVLRPDVLIYLPGDRHLIIDAKVSLTAYEKYVRAENNEAERLAAGKEFSLSLRRHVEDLSSKNYAHVYGINSPDFVMLFVPMDGAFALAHQLDPQLFNAAMEKRVAIVPPSLLFPNLKTIETIWRQDRQNRNAEEIARQAGGLYDKFVGLLDDLESIGSHLQKAEKSRHDLLSKIQSERGNLLGRIENLRELGAKTKKRLPLERDN